MTGMLASVGNLNEALLIQAFDVDVIDLKQPGRGALGAWEPATVRAAVKALPTQSTLSATVGDLPMQPEVIVPAVSAMAATGVDFVKIGFFPGGDWTGTLTALTELSGRSCSMIAVLFADAQPDFTVLTAIKEAGFKGVMIDTMNKRKGSLTGLMPASDIERFVASASACGLLCGLAGSLRVEDIPQLAAYRPDYLGFRGALCRQHDRTGALDEVAIQNVKAALHKAGTFRHRHIPAIA